MRSPSRSSAESSICRRTKVGAPDSYFVGFTFVADPLSYRRVPICNAYSRHSLTVGPEAASYCSDSSLEEHYYTTVPLH